MSLNVSFSASALKPEGTIALIIAGSKLGAQGQALDKALGGAISRAMETLLLSYADNMLRYKGLLWIKDEPRRLLFQGVQRLYSADFDREWREDDVKQSVLIFIGMQLPEQEIRNAFATLTA